MKRIGLLGGMSWESSAEYYRLINEEVRERLGGLHSADCLLRSVDFADIEQLQREGSCSSCARTPCTRSPTRSWRPPPFRSSTSPTPRPKPYVRTGSRRSGC